MFHLLIVSQEDGAGSSEGEGPELSVHSEIFGTKSGNEASVEVLLGHGHLLYWEYLKHNKVKYFSGLKVHFVKWKYLCLSQYNQILAQILIFWK